MPSLARLIIVAAVIAVFAGSAGAQSGKTDFFKRYSATWKAAHAARAQGKCHRAVALYTQGMQLAKQWQEGSRRRSSAETGGLLFRGECLRRLGEYGKALVDLMAVAESDYLGNLAWVAPLEIGLVHLALNRRQQAQVHFRWAIRTQERLLLTARPDHFVDPGKVRRHVRVGEPYLRICVLGRSRRPCTRGLDLYEARCKLVTGSEQQRIRCEKLTNARADVVAALKEIRSRR